MRGNFRLAHAYIRYDMFQLFTASNRDAVYFKQHDPCWIELKKIS